MTQIQLAELLNQAPHAYQYYEAGANFPELPKLIALADFYNVSLDYLIGRSETRERQPGSFTLRSPTSPGRQSGITTQRNR